MNKITILHLSDIQFGRNHRFAGHDLAEENPYDTLSSRLCQDLELLNREHGVHPDLIIVTGDLAEWGLRSEFIEVGRFLEQLTGALDLKRRRVIIVPGNHDINRAACEAYFAGCLADEIDPVRPFWPKWKHFSEFFQDFYRDEPSFEFSVEAPWTLFEVPELRTVIAGLNSTIAESHDYGQEWVKRLEPVRHHGWLGEPQLQGFREKLEVHKERCWLRIGAVHHNYQRGCLDDDDNLKDADDLERILGGSLNLLLHGHTHKANRCWIDREVPVFSTGSASLKKEARPEEHPNQYQVIQISDSRIRRLARCYYPEKRMWGADPRASRRLDDWISEDKIQLRHVAAAFPGTEITEAKDGFQLQFNESCSGDVEQAPAEIYSHFMNLVTQACELRNPGATVTRHLVPDHGLSYLAVAHRDGPFVRQYPVGICEHGLTRDTLDRFLALVDARYRAYDPALTSELVYGGSETCSHELVAQAEHRRVRVLSLPEYQGILDLRLYAQRLADRLSKDPVYPPNLYVRQRMCFTMGTERESTDDALEQVMAWIDTPAPRFILLLGDFGTGKTFLLHEVARALSQSGSKVVPVLVQLRALEKAHSLDRLIAQHLAGAGVDRIDLAAFRYMLAQGRIVLLFDGFDELALRVSYDLAAEYFDTLIQAAIGDAKVLVTSRTQHFESEHQIKTILGERAERLPSLRYCKLMDFTEPQIQQFLSKRWDDQADAEDWMELLRDVKDLLGLSQNPRMLRFLTELKKEKLREARERQGAITAASLYQMLLERWLIHELERIDPADRQYLLPREARWHVVTSVALRLWQKSEPYLTLVDLTEEVVSALKRFGVHTVEAGVAAHLIGAGSLLVRDEEGGFFFAHQSVMEWLVARQAAEELNTGDSPRALSVRELSPLMADFFCDLGDPAKVRAWAEASLGLSGLPDETLVKNAMIVRDRLKSELTERNGIDLRDLPLQLPGHNLRGRDFSSKNLQGAVLTMADLTEARLVDADMSEARLDRATLVRANLTSANLSGASLHEADCSEASLLGADLRGAKLRGSRWRRAKLLGAELDAGALNGLDTYGAALPGATEFQTYISFASPCSSLSFSRDGSLLASGHADGIIRLWDMENGEELRRLQGHENWVRSVAFSSDGRNLVSGSSDNTVRLWDAETGKELRRLAGHENWVRSVAFSPAGQSVASASDDRTVRLWDTGSGMELRRLEGHESRVLGVAFDQHGQKLATGGSDGTVRLWDVESGRERYCFPKHGDAVNHVAFSPDGMLIASGSSDNTVRLWDIASGLELRRFQGHDNWVLYVAFSPDGKRIASGSDDNSVRLWDVEKGGQLQSLQGCEKAVLSVAFSLDGRYIVSGSADKTIRLWDAESGREIRRSQGNENEVLSVDFTPDGRHMVSGSNDKTVRVWDLKTGRELQRFRGHEDGVTGVAVSPDGGRIATCSTDNTMRLWAAENGRVLGHFHGQGKGVLSVAFSPDGGTIVSCGAEKTVRAWDAETCVESRTFEGHENWVWSVAFSPDGQLIITGSADKTVRLWDAKSCQELHRYKGHEKGIMSVAFSPDGQHIASGSTDNTIRLWHAESGRELHCLRGHEGWVRSVSFAPDGQTVVSGAYDKSVRFWDMEKGLELFCCHGHEAWVTAVAFSPDGRSVASGGHDNTMRLWDAKTGKPQLILVHLADGWLAFAPDGRYKHHGNLAGGAWHAVGLCRFKLGELDSFMPSLRRVALEEAMVDP